MVREKFKVVVKALITHKGKILIGQKEQDEDHPIGGEWHFLGGHLEKEEKLEEALKREVKEETGLEGQIHQIIDAITFNKGTPEESAGILYHFEADSKDAEPLDDLQDVKWVEPENLVEELGEEEAERVKNRKRQQKFVEKLEKTPVF